MGLFSQLLTLPLAPVRGTAWVAEKLQEEAERRLYDEAAIRREMIELDLAAEQGEITETEHAEREDALLERLAIARERAWHEQQEIAAEQAAESGIWAAELTWDEADASVGRGDPTLRDTDVRLGMDGPTSDNDVIDAPERAEPEGQGDTDG